MKSNFWIKRGMSLVACLVMISATTVAAAGNTRLIHSQGQYTLNSTEGPIIIDTDDIEDNAEAIAALQGQLGGLSFRYGTEKDMGISDNEDKSYYWSKDTSGNWVKVGAVGSAVATDVLTGKKFSSEAGVDIPGSMPNPTSANVTYYNGGDNESSGATSTTPKVVTISNDTDTTASHTDNVSQINLGVNEQITIPHGYYNKDIVIKNGVANRGSLRADNTEVGYYDDIDIGSLISSQIKYKGLTRIDYKSGYTSTIGGSVSLGSTIKENNYSVYILVVGSMDWAGDYGSCNVSVTSGHLSQGYSVGNGTFLYTLTSLNTPCNVTSSSRVSNHSCNSTLVIYGL